MRILTLLARHGVSKYPYAAERLRQHFARQSENIAHDMIVVDTALPADHEQKLDGDQLLLGSSNEHWEFSAWDRAIDHIGDRIHEYHLVHLATSAFDALDAHHLRYCSSAILNLLIGQRAVAGHIDYYTEPVVLFGSRLQCWLRSSWMFIAPHELQRLGSTVTIRAPAELFSGHPEAPFRTTAPLSANFKQHVVGWLTGERSTLGGQWHSQFALSHATLPFFEAKATAILNEHLLSRRLQAQGCSLLDVTWLALRQSTGLRSECLPELVPSWRWQVASRSLVSTRQPSGESTAMRAALVVGECSDIARTCGEANGRKLLWRAVARDRRLLTQRPVLGAMRRFYGLADSSGDSARQDTCMNVSTRA